MELTTIAGIAAGPFLAALLSWLFTILGRVFYQQWDPTLLPNGAKRAIAPVVGVWLGILAMFADTILLTPPLEINIVSIIKYCVAGFSLGVLSIGYNELTKGNK